MKLRFGLALLLFSLSIFLPSVKAGTSCTTDADCFNQPGNCMMGVPSASCCFFSNGGFCVPYCPLDGQSAPACNAN
jgi:hypothetical protein